MYCLQTLSCRVPSKISKPCSLRNPLLPWSYWKRYNATNPLIIIQRNTLSHHTAVHTAVLAHIEQTRNNTPSQTHPFKYTLLKTHHNRNFVEHFWIRWWTAYKTCMISFSQITTRIDPVLYSNCFVSLTSNFRSFYVRFFDPRCCPGKNWLIDIASLNPLMHREIRRECNQWKGHENRPWCRTVGYPRVSPIREQTCPDTRWIVNPSGESFPCNPSLHISPLIIFPLSSSLLPFFYITPHVYDSFPIFHPTLASPSNVYRPTPRFMDLSVIAKWTSRARIGEKKNH